jgi:imidazolonepropionase
MAKTVLFRNIDCLLTLAGVAQKDGRHVQEADLSIIKKAAIAVQAGKIAWVGSDKKIPKNFQRSEEIDLAGQMVLPGFVECHTHLIFAGSRADEFEQRNRGMSYQEIAAAGGGILSTVKSTRKASEKQLLAQAQKRVDRFIEQGVTTLEIKSGYALDLAGELKCLEVAAKLGPIDIVPTFLGAHALPQEFPSTSQYLQFLLTEVLPKIRKKKLAKRVDIFVEKGFFQGNEAKEYLQKAQALGFSICLHAEQLSLSGGGDLAVDLAADSADHLIQVSDSQIHRLATSEVTCTLLPAADLYMKCAFPPARKMIEQSCRIALATDYNPGSSPTQDLSLVGLLARLEMKMTLPEVIAAYTYNAAAALKKQQNIGTIEVGKDANFFSTSVDWTDLFYSVGQRIPENLLYKGRNLKLKPN